jgi:hypothetical protein
LSNAARLEGSAAFFFFAPGIPVWSGAWPETGGLLNRSSLSEQGVKCAPFVTGSRTLHIRTRGETNAGVVHGRAE